MPTNKLSKQTLRFFSDSGLTKAHAEKMHIRDVTSQEIKNLFSKMRFSGENLSGHEIPYFDLLGNPISHARYRLHDDGEGSLPKYLQVAGTKSRFYFPPFVAWDKIAKDPSIPIYITEGERKAAKACIMGLPCLGLGGVWNWLSKNADKTENENSQPIKDFQLIEWKSRTVIIVFDSDSQFNTNIQDAIRKLRNTLVQLKADPYRIDMPHKAGSNKVGLDDFLKRPSGKKAFENLPRVPLLLNKTMTAEELLTQNFGPTKWVIKGLIPSGLTILAGPAKVGKSWLILEFILAIASGKRSLNHYEIVPTKCLYLALEDAPRRLKKRIQKLISAGYTVNGLSSFAYEWEQVDNGGIMALERHLDEDPTCKVVFIDTFAKMRTAPRGRENLYHQDYEAVSILKRIADQRDIGIIVVHHTKKGATEDFLESVSGSMGITGAADTVIVLRRGRNEHEGIIEVAGRDVGEQAIALNFKDGVWTYKGEASTVRATETQQEILEILRTENKPLRQREIASIAGRKNAGFTKTLNRMIRDKLVVRKGYHYYLPEEKPEQPKKFAKQEMTEDME